ncbi:hypothetical protein [Salinisphaera hydrothermalis]|uniref:Lipoprotein n=1 Tax=Salinisphaera hydrothermalis (strain C41B8) TaxID=1304275 RepID=A0A084INP5_SALHC|nr:hypothetical protein [Salinisphaera hydrothermalis]KEZ78329.1 hypothetical protein C41B8_05488 [Salinisphaera hydrothermalis C41B8]
MSRRALIAAGTACVLLAACASAPEPKTRVETVTVKEPVYVRPTPPDFLMAPLYPDGPPSQIFVAPDDPKAVLGVTRAGLKQFWQAIDTPVDRIEEWQAWATSGQTEAPDHE